MNAKEDRDRGIARDAPVPGPEQKDLWGSDAIAAMLRAAQIADTSPRRPVYVNLDAAPQEGKIGPLAQLPDVSRVQPDDDGFTSVAQRRT